MTLTHGRTSKLPCTLKLSLSGSLVTQTSPTVPHKNLDEKHFFSKGEDRTDEREIKWEENQRCDTATRHRLNKLNTTGEPGSCRKFTRLHYRSECCTSYSTTFVCHFSYQLLLDIAQSWKQGCFLSAWNSFRDTWFSQDIYATNMMICCRLVVTVVVSK